MNDNAHSTDGVEQTEEFSCPYPNCDWSPSRPVDSEVPLRPFNARCDAWRKASKELQELITEHRSTIDD